MTFIIEVHIIKGIRIIFRLVLNSNYCLVLKGKVMNFKRKVYSRLLEWKEKYSDKYGFVRGGKTSW